MLHFIVTVANPGVLEDLIAFAAFDRDLMIMGAMLLPKSCSLERGGVTEIALELLAMRLHMLL